MTHGVVGTRIAIVDTVTAQAVGRAVTGRNGPAGVMNGPSTTAPSRMARAVMDPVAVTTNASATATAEVMATEPVPTMEDTVGVAGAALLARAGRARVGPGGYGAYGGSHFFALLPSEKNHRIVRAKRGRRLRPWCKTLQSAPDSGAIPARTGHTISAVAFRRRKWRPGARRRTDLGVPSNLQHTGRR